MSTVAPAGIFPKHRFALLAPLAEIGRIVVSEPDFTVPDCATDVFEDLVQHQLAGKQLTRGERNIIHVTALKLVHTDSGIELDAQAQRCDYAAYLGLARSLNQLLSDGTTLRQRYGQPLFRVISVHSPHVIEVVEFPPFGCTLGLCGMVTSADGYLITKKKGVVYHTATDYGCRLPLAASQVRYDYPDESCYERANPAWPWLPGQLHALLRNHEATPTVAEACQITPCAAGIFLTDHHPEVYFHVVCDLPHHEIIAQVSKAPRFEGVPEAIALEDHQRLHAALNPAGAWSLADHHAGGLITLLCQLGQHDVVADFLPTEPLPREFD